MEFNYQAYIISGKDSFKNVDIVRGTVNIDTNELTEKSTKKIIKVIRTPTNARKRPNAHRRHDPIVDEVSRESYFKFQYTEDLEYLSLNYRKERAAKMCSSNRRIVLMMFQKEVPYFPSLKEIRDELIEA